MVAPREWKSQAAEQIQLMGARGSSEVLFGAAKRQMPADELLPREYRQEALRRAARSHAPQRTRSIGFRAWLHR
ncbi:MAG: hypothetical protein OXL97_02675 [Chloroflexota bacterium]|nr:hypothetical protein [Chloroflexota bacterium]MDE2884464.1 hypothetical protein [Chloroflexota bacterium]